MRNWDFKFEDFQVSEQLKFIRFYLNLSFIKFHNKQVQSFILVILVFSIINSLDILFFAFAFMRDNVSLSAGLAH